MNAVNDFISSVPRVWRGDGISFRIMEIPKNQEVSRIFLAGLLYIEYEGIIFVFLAIQLLLA